MESALRLGSPRKGVDTRGHVWPMGDPPSDGQQWVCLDVIEAHRGAVHAAPTCRTSRGIVAKPTRRLQDVIRRALTLQSDSATSTSPVSRSTTSLATNCRRTVRTKRQRRHLLSELDGPPIRMWQKRGAVFTRAVHMCRGWASMDLACVNRLLLTHEFPQHQVNPQVAVRAGVGGLS
jgi:hypothetical protein